jgi:regulator of PEP synthase PpsR (kinase-PPPase family)
MGDKDHPHLYFVSDGRGGTCERLVKAALVQFRGQEYRIVSRPNVRTSRRIRSIVSEAAEKQGIIFYTLVSDATRQSMSRYARDALVPTVDLLGPTFRALHDIFHVQPQFVPGLFYESEREHFDRVDAIDYTLTHDDGQRPHELKDADVILVGVSRASKSSTCFYLAYEGVRAANVPLLPDIEPPRELLDIDPGKVIGLTVNVLRLLTVRESRVSSLHLGTMPSYLDKRAVAREILHANRLMDQHGWRRIDVSYMAIEEIGKEVMRLRSGAEEKEL